MDSRSSLLSCSSSSLSVGVFLSSCSSSSSCSSLLLAFYLNFFFLLISRTLSFLSSDTFLSFLLFVFFSQDAIKGLILLTPELEETAKSLAENRVPLCFSRVSYPSLKPLSSWLKDLIQRLDFFQRWIDHGHPTSFWLSGFFFTQSFLTGILQSYARKEKIPVDEIAFDFDVLPSTTTAGALEPMLESAAGAEGGLRERSEKNSSQKEESCRSEGKSGCCIYGLYMDGARWDSEAQVKQQQEEERQGECRDDTMNRYKEIDRGRKRQKERKQEKLEKARGKERTQKRLT